MVDTTVYAFERDVPLHDYQRASVAKIEAKKYTSMAQRWCLYYKTGAGKTRTALAAVRVLGYTECVIIAPPTTHKHWEDTARAMGYTGVLTVFAEG